MQRCNPRRPFGLYGRGGDFEQAARKEVQLYGQVADSANAVAIPVLHQTNWQIEDPGNDPRDKDFNGGQEASLAKERLWLVETHIQSAISSGEAIPVATRSQIAGRTFPGATFSDRGIVQVQLELENHAGGGRVQLDAGQSIEVYAVGVSAAILAPSSYTEVLPTSVIVGRDGIVENVIVALAILPIEESIGKRRVQFTQLRNIAAGATLVLEIPPFARHMQIRQAAAGVASPNWFLEYSGAGAGLQTEVPFVARQTAIVDVGNATHLRSDIDVANARLFQVVWTIET